MRRIIKKIVFISSLMIVSPLIFISKIEEKITSKEEIFQSLGHFLSLFPGKMGSYLRSSYYWGTLSKSDWETYIGFGSYFTHRNASMGKKTSIGAYCIIGSVHIKKNVLLGSRISILSGKYHHIDKEGKLSHESVRLETVRIGSGSWIGDAAVIMADLGDNCVVSAGSVVTKSMPDNHTAVGNPARFLKFN